MKVLSRVDPDTYYVVTNNHVRMVRNGDKLTIPYSHIPEQSKRFIPEIQAELMGFWEERYPARPCKICGKMFHTLNKIYCSPECQAEGKKAANRARLEEKRRQPRVCEHCGKVFELYAEGAGHKYCSAECRTAATTIKQREKAAKKRQEKRKSQLGEKLQQAAMQGVKYADLQKQETLSMVGRVVV